jgi:tetratricopeptide (TPR) repeat protein
MRKSPLCLAAALLLGLGLSQLRAEYIPAEIEKVPVSRLAENLEGILKKEPKNVQVRFNLARLHAMAYALKADETSIRKGREQDGAWFGYEPRPVPFEVKKNDDAGKEDAARKHLEKAINLYDEVVKEKPDHLIAQLGRAWCVAQRGKKDDAVKEYRKVIETAWEKEKDLKTAPLGWHGITSETARYLIPLLDAEKDKEEIETLKKRTEQLRKVPRPITPIALPLRDGMSSAEMIDLSARVSFDADGSGLQRTWTWIHRDAGWLVYDPRHTGKITSALQLFGSVSFWCFWDNGYQALSALDDDGDGWLRGKELTGLAVWRDANGNGVCEPGEVKPLDEYGIIAIRCRADAGPSAPHCAAQALRGVVFKDGSTRPTFDFVLRQVPPPEEQVVPEQPQEGVPAQNERPETTVVKGLRWLALHQAPDGSWSLDQFHKHAREKLDSNQYAEEKITGQGMKNDVAGTAFGVLPFLAAGITHKPSGKAEDDQYVKTVQKGLRYLMQKQGKDGRFPGDMYTQALATLTLSEAYGSTADPMLKKPAQTALDFIVSAQDPKAGGWRYQPREGSDTSVTGWQLLALKSGQMAALSVPITTFKKAERWLDSVKGEDGGYGYTAPGSTATMTASALLCRMWMGTPRKSPELVKGIALLEKLSRGKEKDRYHLFWTTQVMFRHGGEAWKKWDNGDQTQKGFRELLTAAQDKDGSWNPAGEPYGRAGGRVMSTSLALLCLEMYYRHLPLNRGDAP